VACWGGVAAPDKQHETNRQLLHNSARNVTSHKHHKMYATQPKRTGRGRDNGGDRPPHPNKMTSGHYTPNTGLSVQHLMKWYNSVGVGKAARQTRCPHCLGVADLEHRQNWRRCVALCPACPQHAQHVGQVSHIIYNHTAIYSNLT
jgi:hypothetical protein